MIVVNYQILTDNWFGLLSPFIDDRIFESAGVTVPISILFEFISGHPCSYSFGLK